MGEKYLFSQFSIPNKEFNSPILYNFLSVNKNNYNDYEIKYMNSNLMILNNYNEKIFYFFEFGIDFYFLIKNKYNYYSNIVINDNYLLFDENKNNNIEYILINLLNNLEVAQNELGELFNFKIDNNYPTFLSFNNENKICILYEKNQICVADFHLLKNENLYTN